MGWLSSSPSNQARRNLAHDRKMIRESERDVRANNKAFAREAAKKAAKAAKKK